MISIICYATKEKSIPSAVNFTSVCGLFIVVLFMLLFFVDLRAMLAHLERRLSAIPWAAGRQQAGTQSARRQIVPLPPTCRDSLPASLI